MINPEIYAGLREDEQRKFVCGSKSLSIQHIIKRVGNVLSVTSFEITGLDRHKNIVEARHIAIYLSRKYNPKITLMEIGEIFNRDHSTVIYSIKIVEDLISTEKTFRQKLNECEQNL